ncbi:DNA-J related domain-containing protein [Teredinibacter haidensis]|uniref:DNA-J related domain-containing protein n=1 Tax=Teredinibacter haidensis TaxID=2731755 RepID=UPI000948CE6C|nr:DNA-J related domain-containing protein [Teredinibacter haidensis]
MVAKGELPSQEVLDRALDVVITQVQEKEREALNGGSRQCSISEYECVQLIKKASLYAWSSDPVLALFQQHFIFRHSAYCYRAACAEAPLVAITPNGLTVYQYISEGRSCDSVSTDLDSSSALADYYLNLQNFIDATPDTVASQLAQFWKKYGARDGFEEALLLLGLDNTASKKDIQARYRVLAQTHHPDRGGKADIFIDIKSAYQLLKQYMD